LNEPILVVYLIKTEYIMEIKQLGKAGVGFYPVTVGQAVIFLDGTNAEVTEPQMDLIFGWNRNYISLTSTESDNYLIVEKNSSSTQE